MIEQGQTARPTVLKADTRPEARDPRFVGDGGRLRVVVLVALALVLVAGVVLVAMAIDRGIDAIRRDGARRDAAARTAKRRAVEVASRDDRARAAAPSAPGNPAEWITEDDYPPDALRNNEEGTVTITWVADPDGRIDDCKTLHSSGHASLDSAACTAILRRGRYAAVPVGQGPRVFTRRVVWRIPG